MDEHAQQNPKRHEIEFSCTTIKIGNYVYSPKATVSMSSESIKIIAPHLHDASKDVVLKIPSKQVLRILKYTGDRTFPMIFIYAMNKVGAYVRNEIGMTESSDVYYNPMSREDCYKRITLLPEAITADIRVVFKVLFHKIMDNLNYREAVDIYSRSCYKLTENCESGSESSSQAEHLNQNHRRHAVNTTPNSLISIGNGDKVEDAHHDSTSSINSLVYKRRNSIAIAESDGSKRSRADSNDYPTNGMVSAEENNRPESVQNVTAPIIDDLFVAVTTEPYQDLTLKQATNIRKSLERKLMDNLLCPATSAETSKVRFRDQAHFCDGVLKIQCENHEALAWIREAVPSVPAPIADTTLVVKSQADVKRILCRLFVPDDDYTEIDRLIRLLHTQNTAVDVNSWTIIQRDRLFENAMPGVRLYLRVPIKDVNTLESQQRRLYWLMGNIFIEINSSMSTPKYAP